MTRCFLLCITGIGLLFALPTPPAYAWKPKTHVYLAEQAIAEALKTGKVTIYEVNPTTNQLKRVNGNLVKIGEYKVDPRILDALKKYPKQFRAGVLGPDAFPDILTGQQIIHPAGKITPGETGVDINKGGPGSNAWLQHLWNAAFAAKGIDATPATRAFVVGFLAHAAGDMFGHTCVNHYTGDAFHFNPKPQNALRHILVEGFFDKHVPAPKYESSIADGVEGFIYRQMTQGAPGTAVGKLLVGANVDNTLAARFNTLRNKLAADVKGKSSINPVVKYKKEWIKDIDAGLKKLPDMSHRLAIALMFNSSGKAKVVEAKKIVDDYVKKHLLSMAGVPDALPGAMVLLEKVVAALKIAWLKNFIAEIKKDALNYIVKKATGMTVKQFEEALLAEANSFDRVMDQPPLKGGHRTNQKLFKANELKMDKPTGFIDYTRVAPAYNTVVMIKLALLSKAEVNRLMKDLGSKETLAEENAMLGFVETLDGSNQWKVNAKKMIVARHLAGYRRVFMKQNGEERKVGSLRPAPKPRVTAKR